MKKVLVLVGLFLLMGAGALWAQQKVVVGGSGGVFDEVKEMVKLYQAKNPSHQIEIMADSLPTGASIEATKAGRLTIGLVGRPLHEDEKGKLFYHSLARSPVGVGVHKSNSVSNLSESQICDVFSGKIKSWRNVGGSDGKILVLTVIKKNDTFGEDMRKQMACFRDLKFSPEAVVLNRVRELQDAINHRPETIGLINVAADLTEVRPNLKAVAINGVLPSAEALRAGKYNYSHEYGAITVGEPQGVVKSFLEFITSPEAHKIFLRNGMTPVR